MSGGMTAEAIGQAAKYDMQFKVPERPVARRGVRLRRDGKRIALDGAHRPQVFSGRFAAEHLERLLELSDGTRDHAAIALELGLGQDAVFKALALLWTAGAVEEFSADGDRALTAVAPEYACLLSRLGDSTGANASWVGAVDRLRAARIALRGDADLVRAVSELLAPMTLVPPGAGIDAECLTVYLETTASAADVDAVARECWEDERALLRVRLSGSLLDIGPYVDPAFTPCHECADSAGPLLPPGPHRELAVGLIARELHAFVSQVVPSALPMDAPRIDLSTLATTTVPLVTRPGCPRCAVSGGPVSAAPPLGAVYEQAVAIPPRQFVGEKGHQAHYKTSNLKLQYEFRDWPGCPRIELPPADLDRLDAPWRGSGSERAGVRRPNLRDVATILLVSCGLRPVDPAVGKLRRWTAAGGNIGSVTAFVAVRDSAILDPGTYVYLERDHSLARVSATVPEGAAPLDLAFGGHSAKVARKYAAFALRIVIQDSGCSLAVALEAAHALGIALRPVADWDDLEWHRACATDPEREPMTAVLALGG